MGMIYFSEMKTTISDRKNKKGSVKCSILKIEKWNDVAEFETNIEKKKWVYEHFK